MIMISSESNSEEEEGVMEISRGHDDMGVDGYPSPGTIQTKVPKRK